MLRRMDLRAAADSLTGLSVGDALGAPFEMRPALPAGRAVRATAPAADGGPTTMCAIAGGIVAANVGVAGIPAELIDAREALTEWFQSP